MGKKKDSSVTQAKPKKGRKKIIDPFSKKDWYDVQAPSIFPIRHIGKTPVTRSTGQKDCTESLKGRIFKVSLGDLKPDGEDEAYRQFLLRIDEVLEKNCLTGFHGMTLSRDKQRSLVRKWQTLIEAHADIKTSDDYHLRLFCIGFTRRRPNQFRKTSYAQHAQIKSIRRKMIEIMKRETANCDVKDLIGKLIPEAIGKEIEKACQGIYPLVNVFIRKVKLLRAPKVDAKQLLEMHGGVEAMQVDTEKEFKE